jgi:transposase
MLLHVLVGRYPKDEVIDFLRLIPEKLQKTVKTVCCDLWEGFIEAVHQEIPEAQIVADRFHVSRHYRDAADDVRTPALAGGARESELQRLKKELSIEDYKKLKGSLWAYRKNVNDLTPEERRVLNLFFRLAPLAKKAHKLRELPTAIFEMPITKAQAQKKIRIWIKKVRASGLRCFVLILFSTRLNIGGKKSPIIFCFGRTADLSKALITKSKYSSEEPMAYIT